MHKNLLFLILLFLSIVFITACNKNKQGTIELPKIPVVHAVQRDMPIYSEFVGQIYGVKDIPIRARVEGFLTSINFQEGSIVKKGQLLYTIDPQKEEARYNAKMSEVTAAQTTLQKAKADLDRIEPLAKANAVSKRDLDAARAAYEVALANLKSAKSNLRSSKIDLSYTKIYSPINGIIGRTNAREGEFVGREPNPVILNTVSKIDPVLVKFYLTETEFLKFSKDFIRKYSKKNNNDEKQQDVIVQLKLSDGEIYNHYGKIDFIDRNINTSTGSIMIQASFPNPERLLRPGMYCKVIVETDIKKNAIVVPLRCVTEMQGEFSVFVVNDSNKVESRRIKISNKIGDLGIVSDGIKPGERIVIDALQKVRPGMKVMPIDTTFKSTLLKPKSGKKND